MIAAVIAKAKPEAIRKYNNSGLLHCFAVTNDELRNCLLFRYGKYRLCDYR